MSETEILPVLFGCIRELMPEIPESELTAQSSLRELGLNSMERAEVIISAQDALRVRMPLTAFAGAANIGAIADVMAARA